MPIGRGSIRILTLLLLVAGCLHGQTPIQNPTLAFQYQFQQPDGNNAATVAWNSEKQIYLTAFSGNREFPVEAFGPTGQPMGKGTAGFDLRGIWYNPKTKGFEANGFAGRGWLTFPLKPDNSPDEPRVIFGSAFQPNEQSVGSYDSDMKKVIFLNAEGGAIVCYKRKQPKQQSRIPLEWKDVKAADVNSTSVGYTGAKNAEFVLLDHKNRRLVFFNRAGRTTFKSDLPIDAPVNAAFCFAFANDHAFLYDKATRTWYAYRVF